MLKELRLVLEHVPTGAAPAKYAAAIVEENVLAKPTRTTRARTAKRLGELYALDPGCTLFRLLRHFWPADSDSHPMLAFLAACGRDPLLREATQFVLSVRHGQIVTPCEISEYLGYQYPARFQAKTLLATAQRLASSWTQAGYLRGKVTKRRTRPQITPVVVAFAFLLGYFCRHRGKLLLDCNWTRLLDCAAGELSDLAVEASKQGWMRYKALGSVVEVTFPGLLKPSEEQAAYEQD